MQAGAVRHGPGTPIDRLRSRRMTPDDATAGPSSAPLTPSPLHPKAPSPTKAAAPVDKENTPEADAKSCVQGRPANPQRMSGHSRTPSGHDAMTRDMGNLQLNSANRHNQPFFAVHHDYA